ncbi:MAG: DUF1499 domain-containing protein [Rhodospirillaceae bacterium]|nr:DUF1499 domain-containing protein [Rhodospirillaceae bacterium]
MTQFCDFGTLKLKRWPNQFLMLPEGFAAVAEAHETSPVFREPPEALYDRLKSIVAAEPRIQWLSKDRGQGRMELMQRSKIFRFPDRISIAVVSANTEATLAIYSRTVFGGNDFNVNKTRVLRWITALKSG